VDAFQKNKKKGPGFSTAAHQVLHSLFYINYTSPA